MDDYAGRLLKFVVGCGVGWVLAMGLEYMAMKLWAWRKDEDEQRARVKAGIGAVVRSVMAGESAAREKACARAILQGTQDTHLRTLYRRRCWLVTSRETRGHQVFEGFAYCCIFAIGYGVHGVILGKVSSEWVSNALWVCRTLLSF